VSDKHCYRNQSWHTDSLIKMITIIYYMRKNPVRQSNISVEIYIWSSRSHQSNLARRRHTVTVPLDLLHGVWPVGLLIFNLWLTRSCKSQNHGSPSFSLWLSCHLVNCLSGAINYSEVILNERLIRIRYTFVGGKWATQTLQATIHDFNKCFIETLYIPC